MRLPLSNAMVGVWIVYLELLLGAVIFLFANQQWLAWLLLMALLWLPLLSFAVSLPAMLTTQVSCAGSGTVEQGEKATVQVTASCKLPAPPIKYILQAQRVPTGEHFLIQSGKALPTEHCGQLICRIERCYVYDYLRLLRFRVRKVEGASVVVLPKPLKMKTPDSLERRVGLRWKPKPGGGFSENHELRLYQPGDGLNQVHWKLTAKMGKLMIRQPMVAENNRLPVQVEICGSAQELDRKMGRLRYLAQQLLQENLSFTMQVLWEKGMESYEVSTPQTLEESLRKILCLSPAKDTQISSLQNEAGCLRIGGDADAV